MISTSTPAGAQYCEGTVHGLSGRYNLATGSGFLAVRTRPNSSSRMNGQLFNGDHPEIFDRRGNWYQVEIGGRTGWANARWLREIAATETSVHVTQKWIRFWDNDMHQTKT